MTPKKSAQNAIKWFVAGCVGTLIFAIWGIANADETPPAPTERTIVVKSGQNMEIPAPGPGEHLTVIVKRPKAKQQVNVTNVYNDGNNLQLRGGLSVGYGFPARTTPSRTFGLVGEIGKTDSPWVIDLTFQAGWCKQGVALNGGLAALRSVTTHFRLGVGADLLYCSNVSDYNVEKAKQRIAGGSFNFGFFDEHFVLGGKIGLGAATWPVPGDRKTEAVFYGGVDLSYLF